MEGRVGGGQDTGLYHRKVSAEAVDHNLAQTVFYRLLSPPHLLYFPSPTTLPVFFPTPHTSCIFSPHTSCIFFPGGKTIRSGKDSFQYEWIFSPGVKKYPLEKKFFPVSIYCSLSVSHKYLALEGYYLPISVAVPSNTTHKRTDRLARPLHGTGLLPSPARYHKSDLHSTLARFAR